MNSFLKAKGDKSKKLQSIKNDKILLNSDVKFETCLGKMK